MPAAEEHFKVQEYLKYSLNKMEENNNRLYAWEIVNIFYKAVHLIEEFRAKYIQIQ
ncbi:MAG: hypothetical protein ACTSYA_08750 [Candidatus Kariarchaeaceae archaeon]